MVLYGNFVYGFGVQNYVKLETNLLTRLQTTLCGTQRNILSYRGELEFCSIFSVVADTYGLYMFYMKS